MQIKYVHLIRDKSIRLPIKMRRVLLQRSSFKGQKNQRSHPYLFTFHVSPHSDHKKTGLSRTSFSQALSKETFTKINPWMNHLEE